MHLSPNKHDSNLCCHLVLLEGKGEGEFLGAHPQTPSLMSRTQHNDVRGIAQTLFLQYMVTCPPDAFGGGFWG